MIDLRSDTVTLPTGGMRRAMSGAAVGDDIYGEDPTVRELEERCSVLFGAEGAVFMPTVTMANLVGLVLLAGPGEEIICDVNAHIVRYESGAAAVSGGIQTRTTADPRGIVPVSVLADLVRSGQALSSSSGVRTKAVAVEQTHNQYGGRVYPLAELRALRAFADERGIGIHCDGARIWNAHVAAGEPLDGYGRLFESTAVCLSKGLGCPAGALLVLADGEAIPQARALRRRQGGSMRQVGVLAAAGLYALRHHLGRLRQDHDRARRLAEAAESARAFTVSHPVDTNIVYLDLPASQIQPFLHACKAQGLLLTSVQGKRARMVTHLGITDGDVGRAITILCRELALLPPAEDVTAGR